MGEPAPQPPVSASGLTPGRVESTVCPTCHTDEGFRVRLYNLDGEDPIPVGTITGCARCSRERGDA